MSTTMPYDDPERLGMSTAEALRRIMMVYNIRQRRDRILTREVLTFENRQEGANEWIQLNVSIITDPLHFHLPDTCLTGWTPLPVANRLVDSVTDILLRIIDKCQAHGADPQLAQDIVEIADTSLIKIVNQLNDINHQ